MKSILEFDLPKESNEHKLAINGSKYYNALWDISQWLRSEIKHSNKDYSTISVAFYNILDNHNIILDEIE